MTGKIQNIILTSGTSRLTRVFSHLVFWLVVGFFYFLVFSWNSQFREVSIIFSIGLLPVAVVATYFFNYTLVPKFLWQKHYGKFFYFSFMTLLSATWLSFLIVFFALIYILETQASLEPAVLHPELQVISLNFIVFFAIAIKQVKRAFFMYQEKNELEKTKLATELKLKEAELKLLKAQIHPHFLFNTLNNLYGLTIEKSDDAPKLVLRLSEILDYILYRCEEPRVSLAEEIANLQNYIEIERIRYPEKIKLNIKLPVDTGDLKIAPLIILPFVENAFKHGAGKSTGEAFVLIQVEIKDQFLMLKIENSKNREELSMENITKGIGLINVKKRLELTYPNKFILKIENSKTTFLVNLTLELEN